MVLCEKRTRPRGQHRQQNTNTPKPYLGAFEQGDIDDVSAVFAEDGVFVDPRAPAEEYHGPAGVRRALE